jgi:hypothetical protein
MSNGHGSKPAMERTELWRRFVALAAYLPRQDEMSDKTMALWLDKFELFMDTWEAEHDGLPPLLEYTEGYRLKIRWPKGWNA